MNICFRELSPNKPKPVVNTTKPGGNFALQMKLTQQQLTALKSPERGLLWHYSPPDQDWGKLTIPFCLPSGKMQSLAGEV